MYVCIYVCMVSGTAEGQASPSRVTIPLPAHVINFARGQDWVCRSNDILNGQTAKPQPLTTPVSGNHRHAEPACSPLLSWPPCSSADGMDIVLPFVKQLACSTVDLAGSFITRVSTLVRVRTLCGWRGSMPLVWGGNHWVCFTTCPHVVVRTSIPDRAWKSVDYLWWKVEWVMWLAWCPWWWVAWWMGLLLLLLNDTALHHNFDDYVPPHVCVS